MYQHYVQYYETDKMGVTHHSNYIRFMEEARVVFFQNIGLDYFEFEKKGFISPVVGINNCRYKRPSTAGDTLDIEVAIKAGTHYLGFNFPKDICDECGASGVFDECPVCHSKHITRIRRVSGYLEILDGFTKGKKAEEKNRRKNG